MSEPIHPERTQNDTSGGTRGLAIGIGIAMVAFLALPAIFRSTQPAPPSSETTASSGDTSREFTKSEFRRAVEGKTKSEIRAEFGSPYKVEDQSDTWVYTEIPVYDEAAGSKAMARIRFEGLESADDKVVDVTYF